MTENQELPINNPAERLFVILTRASEANKNATITKVLSDAMKKNALDTSEQDPIKLLELINHIEEQMKKNFPSNTSGKQRGYMALLTEIRENLSKAILLGASSSLTNTWQHAGLLNNPTWTILRFFEACVHDFEEYGVSIDKNLLDDLRNDVESLIKSVYESQLNEDIKNFVIHQLREIKNALDKYYYYGAKGVKKEIYSALVEIGMIQKQDDENEQTEENKNLWRKIFESLSNWASSINPLLNTVIIADKIPPIIKQTAELIGNTIKHLPPGN